MNYIKQIGYEMKHQKMMTWVSIAGTALSIFLVMALFMSEQVKTVETAPESNRSRILMAANLHVSGKNYGSSSTSGINKEIIDKLYGDLDGIEKTSYVNAFDVNVNINVRGKDAVSVLRKKVDNDFWSIYDFRFIDGKPYDKADVEDNARKVILSRSIARQLFGEDKVAGRDVEINYITYNVCGVVEDVNPLLQSSYAEIYLPYKPGVPDEEYFGDVNMVLLLKEGVDAQHIKDQVESRYKTFNTQIADKGDEFVYHLQPYTSEEVSLGGYGSNNEPNLNGHNKKMWIFYTVLILLPAINLSSMTRSRLRHRVTEIGVRRAFGAKKSSIIWQIFGENLLITIFGGILGLILSLAFVYFASHLFFYSGDLTTESLLIINARPTLGMLFQWQNFATALVFCLVLNILSATVPAWRASRVEPAVAIAKSRE